jgi:aminoglycoside phosphotransferase (APT) family kinase protein
MLTPPGGLPEATLAAALGRGWGMSVASAEYRPVGWGSHHWAVTDGAGSRWFVTADELEHKRMSEREPLDAAFGRLRASLAAAADLHDSGAAFVVAPVLTGQGEPLVRVNDTFGVSVYPFLDGQSYDWGEFSSPEHRLDVLRLVAAVHAAPAAASRRAPVDDFAVPHRDALEAAFGPANDVAGRGPYALRTSLLVRRNAAAIRQLLARYDGLVARARPRPGRAVLTHGEPHPGNTMLTAGGLVLIDWDTALVAQPERDLWLIDPGDGTMLGAYASATGISPMPDLLEAYRLRWDIADIAVDVGRFHRPHAGTPEDDKAWGFLASVVERLSQQPS